VLSVAEESPVGTRIGFVNGQGQDDGHSHVTAEWRYRIRSSSAYFDVDELTGLLRTAAVLDREELCPFEPFCELVVDVIATGTCRECSETDVTPATESQV